MFLGVATTSGFGVNKNELENTVYELILGECSLGEAIIKNVATNVSLLPSNVNLAGAEVDLLDRDDKSFILKKELDDISDDYGFIIIDCPPSLNMLTINISLGFILGLPISLIKQRTSSKSVNQ